MAQRKHIGAELGVGASADEDQVGEEASELVREAEKHGRESCPIYPTIRGQDHLARPCRFTCRRLKWRQFELTLGGLPHTCGASCGTLWPTPSRMRCENLRGRRANYVSVQSLSTNAVI
jgi:hypothetical protein